MQRGHLCAVVGGTSTARRGGLTGRLPMVREEAGPPSALLGSVPALGTKAGAFPQRSASAWKAAGCRHLLCGAARMRARSPGSRSESLW